MDYNVHAGADKKENFNLIPKGYRLWCDINHRGIKISTSGSNQRYIDLELTVVAGQPFAGRKVWAIIMDPFDPNLNNLIQAGTGDVREKATNTRTSSLSHLGRILEGAGKAVPERPDLYAFNMKDNRGAPNFGEIHGLRVPILVGIKEDKNGDFPPKNSVNAYLSPNKNRRDYKHYEEILKGNFAPDGGGPIAPPAQTGFGFAQPASSSGGPGGSAHQPAFGAPQPAHAPPPAAVPASPFGSNAQAGPWLGGGNAPANPGPAMPSPATPGPAPMQGWPGQPGRAG